MTKAIVFYDNTQEHFNNKITAYLFGKAKTKTAKSVKIVDTQTGKETVLKSR